MEPINKAERAAATKKFITLYAVSLILPVLAIAFMFFMPNNAILEENKKLKATVEEQQKLLVKMDALNGQLKSLVDLDKQYISETNDLKRGEISTQLNEQEKGLANNTFDLKKDTTALASPVTKSYYRDVIGFFETALTYRNTISGLRNTLSGVSGDKGEIAKRIQQLETEKSQLETDLKIEKAANRNGGGGGGGGGGGDAAKVAALESKVATLEAQVKSLLTQLAEAKKGKPGADCSSQEATISVLRNNISQLEDLTLQLTCDDKMIESRDRSKYYDRALNSLERLKTVALSKKAQIQAKVDNINKRNR